MSNKLQKTSTKIQINHNDINHNTCTELNRNIHSCFGHLIIDIWNLFTHKIINFKGVREITSLSCYLLFVIYSLVF